MNIETLGSIVGFIVGFMAFIIGMKTYEYTDSLFTALFAMSIWGIITFGLVRIFL